MTRRGWKRAKQLGFSDAQLAWLWGSRPRHTCGPPGSRPGSRPTFKTVDTCGAEFEAATPYHYSTYEDEDEVTPSGRRKVLILGSGPNRIGQGIEFDYCCVHASFALGDAGFETVMLNCNPETVSTDYDTSDRLYFEPLTLEDALNVIEAEQAAGELVGVVVALGGQTPLKLAASLPEGLVLGTSPASIDAAEDRELWNALCARLEIPQPAGGTATTVDDALAIVERIGYPALLRPSYVLGGRAMEIVYDEDGPASGDGRAGQLRQPRHRGRAVGVAARADRPVPRGRHRGRRRRHPRPHRRGGDRRRAWSTSRRPGSTRATRPARSRRTRCGADTVAVIEDYTRRLADALDVRGLINVQYAVKQGQVFVIEANPRASRTVPFVAKATGVPLVKVAARVMVGATLAELRAEGLLRAPVDGGHIAVKEAVLPFNRFPDADTVLGPEMRSTGEVMGIDRTFGLAFGKAQISAGDRLPDGGLVFLSLADRDKAAGLRAAAQFVDLGFAIAATRRHRRPPRAPRRAGRPAGGQGDRRRRAGRARRASRRPRRRGSAGLPTALDLISAGKVALVVNSPRGRGARADGAYIRRAANVHRIPCLTTAAAAVAAAESTVDRSQHHLRVRTLQEYHRGRTRPSTGRRQAAAGDAAVRLLPGRRRRSGGPAPSTWR